MDHKQKERQQRGEDFQDEMRRSWRLVSNCWRMRITDGRGSTRPADEVILLSDVNILAEHKRTQGDRFELSFLRPNQLKGLVDFDRVIARNRGLVFVSFLDDSIGLDKAVVFPLIDILGHMKRRGRQYAKLEEFEKREIPGLLLPRIQLDDGPGYDLKGVNNYFTDKR